MNCKIFYRFLLISVLALCLTAGVAIAEQNSGTALNNTGERTVTDMVGRTVSLPDTVDKVMVLYGPGYEKMVILDAEDKIAVAADWHKTHSAWAHVIYKRLDSLPVMSNPGSPNVEEIMKKDPDVVFYFGNDKFTQQMTDLGIPVICSTGGAQDLLSLKDQIRMYGSVLGEKETKLAEEYCTYFDEKLNNVLAKTSSIANSAKPKVYVNNRIPLRAFGGSTLVGDSVEKAGGIYVAKDLNATTEINLEQLLTWNPDIIIVGHENDLPDPSSKDTVDYPTAQEVKEDYLTNPDYQGINAVKNKQVYIDPMGTFFWDAGQQGILQLEWMAQLFHPELFPDLDMKKELKEFYLKFFRYDLSDQQSEQILNHELPPNAAEFGY